MSTERSTPKMPASRPGRDRFRQGATGMRSGYESVPKRGIEAKMKGSNGNSEDFTTENTEMREEVKK